MSVGSMWSVGEVRSVDWRKRAPLVTKDAISLLECHLASGTRKIPPTLSPNARRCRRTEAHNATVGSDDRAASSTPVEANRPPMTDLDARTD